MVLMAGKPANFNSMPLERTALALASTASTCSRKSAKVLSLLADLSAMAPHSEPMAPNLLERLARVLYSLALEVHSLGSNKRS